MKYYYISHDGPFRNNVMPGKDNERITRDKNKIIITRINGKFHVLVCRNGIYEREKMVFSYFELVNFLKKNSFNTYFLNTNGETAYNVSSYVKREEVVSEETESNEQSKRFFTIQGNNMLKIEAYIDRSILKLKLFQVYDEETRDETKSQELTLNEFIDNKELFELYQLPFCEKGGKFVVPNYSYAHPSLFYILSSIYDGSREKIALSSEDITNLYIASILNEEYVKDITKNIEVRILKEYNREEFTKSLEFMELYSKQERDYYIKLKKMKSRLLEADKNKKIVDALGLLEEKKEEKPLVMGKTSQRGE